MLELRMLSTVPEQAASLAYVNSRPLSVTDNVSLVDYSRSNAANAIEFYQTSSLLAYGAKSSENNRLFSDEVILGNRSVLSSSIAEGAQLFYRAHLGRWASMLLVSDSGTVTLDITQTTITLTNGSTVSVYTYTNKTVREIVYEINTFSGNGVAAYCLYPSAADFKTVAGGSITTSGYTVYNETYLRVYNTQASSTDLEAARETIKRTIEVLVDNEKTNELQWDLVVNAYETNGFLCSLYVDRKSEQGKTYQVRYPAITLGGVVQNRTEILNVFPYLIEGFDYTLTKATDYWTITSIADASSSQCIGVFGSGSVTVSPTQITISGTSYTYSGKSMRQVVAELPSTFTSHTFSLLCMRESLDTYSLNQGTFTIEPSGTALRLNQEIAVLSGPSTRIHPLLPYDEEAHRPWYPRVQNGRFSEIRYASDMNFELLMEGPYKGLTALRYNFALPEYTTQTFKKTLGTPYRSVCFEAPIIVSETIIRTRRFPIESLGSIKLLQGDQSVTSSISDVDLEQGFIYLSQSVVNMPGLLIDYTYEERSVVYTGIDLNTVNDPTLVGKFVGVYVIPEEVSYIWSTSQTIYHIVRDTAASITAAVDALDFANGITSRALLLGIYQVIPSESKEDVVFKEAAPSGGGVDEGVPLLEEAAFVTEEGRWDGEPFDAEQTLILEVPETLITTPASTTPFRVDPTKLTGFMSPTGQFSREEVVKAAERWTPPGTCIIVETT